MVDDFITDHGELPMPLVIAGTGHRPPRLGLDYGADSNRRLTEFVSLILHAILKRGFTITEAISGFAQGFDQALAHAAVLLDIPLVAAIPFEGQESKWPPQAQQRYHALLKRAAHVEVVAPGPYAAKKFILRDKWMVDRAVGRMNEQGEVLAVVLALWDRGKDGGTAMTAQYGQRRGAAMLNTWDAWQRYRDGGVPSFVATELEGHHGTGTSSVRHPAGQE